MVEAAGITDAAARRSREARSSVLEVLETFRQRGEQPTVARTATAAGVSRAYLYSQPDLLAAVRELQHGRGSRSLKVPAQPYATTEAMLAQIETLSARNKDLRRENRRLRRRLQTAQGRLKDDDDTP